MDKRHNARGTVTIGSREPRFFVRSEDGVYAITRVHDLSLSGVGIETRYRLRPGERVILKYRYGKLMVSVGGNVAWCTGGSDEAFTIGVAFDPAAIDRNSVFFLALSKYLKAGHDTGNEKGTLP